MVAPAAGGTVSQHRGCQGPRWRSQQRVRRSAGGSRGQAEELADARPHRIEARQQLMIVVHHRAGDMRPRARPAGHHRGIDGLVACALVHQGRGGVARGERVVAARRPRRSRSRASACGSRRSGIRRAVRSRATAPSPPARNAARVPAPDPVPGPGTRARRSGAVPRGRCPGAVRRQRARRTHRDSIPPVRRGHPASRRWRHRHDRAGA